jgi:hypothetical protein
LPLYFGTRISSILTGNEAGSFQYSSSREWVAVHSIHHRHRDVTAAFKGHGILQPRVRHNEAIIPVDLEYVVVQALGAVWDGIARLERLLPVKFIVLGAQVSSATARRTWGGRILFGETNPGLVFLDVYIKSLTGSRPETECQEEEEGTGRWKHDAWLTGSRLANSQMAVNEEKAC